MIFLKIFGENLTLPTDLWSHIYSFTSNPASAALVSKEHRHAAYRGLYIQLNELPVDDFLREIGKNLGKWENQDPDGSIQRWLKARDRAIQRIQIREPRLRGCLQMEPFDPFHWQLQDIKRVSDAFKQNRDARLIHCFEEQIPEPAFHPRFHLAPDLSAEEKEAEIRNWLAIENSQIHLDFNFLFFSPISHFPPTELAEKLTPDTLRYFFRQACYIGDYEFIEAALKAPPCLATLSGGDHLAEPFSKLLERYTPIGQELLNNNPSLTPHLTSARSTILDVASREGDLKVLNAFNHRELNRELILRKACYAGQEKMVRELLKNYPFSSSELAWSLFVTLEGPAMTVSLPLLCIHSKLPISILSISTHCLSVCSFPLIYRRFFPPEIKLEDPERKTIPSPTERSLSIPLLATLGLLKISMPISVGVMIANAEFRDDPLSERGKAIQVISGIAIAIVGGAISIIPEIESYQHQMRRRSLSFLKGFCSGIRETAIGRLKVIQQLGSALLKRTPCGIGTNSHPIKKPHRG